MLFGRRRILHIELGLRDITQGRLDLLEQKFPFPDHFFELFRSFLIFDFQPLQGLHLQFDGTFLAGQRFNKRVDVLGASRDQCGEELRVIFLLVLLRRLGTRPFEAREFARNRALLQYTDAVAEVFRLL